MPIQIVRNDITKMKVDAIVNAANNRLANGGGVTGAIFQAAGPGLAFECSKLGGCKTGEAKITRAYNLPSKYVIHTVGPIWHGGMYGERMLLTSCYLEALKLAKEYRCESIAFPLISSGVFGYPKDQALKTAMDAISGFLLNNDSDMLVYLVVFSKDSFRISQKLYTSIEEYIDDRYVDRHIDYRYENTRARRVAEFREDDYPPCCYSLEADDAIESSPLADEPLSLEDMLCHIDESFSQMVLRKIKEKGIKNADCYKKANLGKQHFSKISNDIHYKPKKQTALAIAVALELSFEETKELLEKAGLAFSHSEKFDIIVEYFIRKGKYDIFEINEVLFYYDQVLLGASIL